MVQVRGSYHGAISQSTPCIIDGHLRTDRNWHGYLANITVVGVARLTFEFVYPVERCCQNILFYRQDQAAIVGARMNCWQKEYLLRPEDDQVGRVQTCGDVFEIILPQLLSNETCSSIQI